MWNNFKPSCMELEYKNLRVLFISPQILGYNMSIYLHPRLILFMFYAV